MKVVLFCGGLGTRLREHTDKTPKPLVNIGQRPILWHLMKYYAHFGHREFILCLGYMGEQVKQYFGDYANWVANDYQLPEGFEGPNPFSRDMADWQVTFADTGMDASIGQRLRAVRSLVGDDPVFLANYSDGLSDVPLDAFLADFRREDRVASFVSVRPHSSFHTVTMGEGKLVRSMIPANEADIWVNGGFFAMKREIFDYLGENEDLVEEPFQRLIDRQQLIAWRHEGFWSCMDTYKDKKAFDDMEERGDMPWKLWQE